MSNVIQFLESLGSKPTLSAAEYASTVAMLDADVPQREALLGRDHDALNCLLGGRSMMRCYIATPDEA